MSVYASAERQDSGAVVVTLGGEHSANAYSRDECRQWMKSTIDLLCDPDVTAVLFRSRRKNFCAGATGSYLDEMLSVPEAATETEELLGQLNAVLTTTDVPVICSVRGACFGVGLIIAVHADLVVVESTTRFQSVHLNMGVAAGVGVASVLPTIIGAKRARQFLLTCRPVRGDEAVQIGLATTLASEGEADRVALELLEQVTGYSTRAVKETKAALSAWARPGGNPEEASRKAEFHAFLHRQEEVRAHLDVMRAKGVLW